MTFRFHGTKSKLKNRKKIFKFTLLKELTNYLRILDCDVMRHEILSRTHVFDDFNKERKMRGNLLARTVLKNIPCKREQETRIFPTFHLTTASKKKRESFL
jgi:hypothetical protein